MALLKFIFKRVFIPGNFINEDYFNMCFSQLVCSFVCFHFVVSVRGVLLILIRQKKKLYSLPLHSAHMRVGLLSKLIVPFDIRFYGRVFLLIV